MQADFPADDGKNKAAQWLGRRGGQARAKSLSSHQRSEIAKKAAAARWKKHSRVSEAKVLPLLLRRKEKIKRRTP
jgi:hypothetical protein